MQASLWPGIRIIITYFPSFVYDYSNAYENCYPLKLDIIILMPMRMVIS